MVRLDRSKADTLILLSSDTWITSDQSFGKQRRNSYISRHGQKGDKSTKIPVGGGAKGLKSYLSGLKQGEADKKMDWPVGGKPAEEKEG